MKKRVFLLICLLLSSPAWSQEIQVVEQHADQPVKLAHPFALQYKLSHTPQSTVTVDTNTLPADFEVTRATFTPDSPGTGTYDFTVMPFTLGKSTFTVTFLLVQDGKTVAKTAADTLLTVAPANVFRDKKLREIRPPKLPSGWWFWLCVLLLAAIILYSWRAWRKRRSQAALTIRREKDNRPCDQIALAQIEALLASGLWERKAYKLFYITLSDILREYLWRQFKVDVSADTSAELVRHVKSLPAMEPLLSPLKDFLNSADLVKFAKAEPQPETRNRDIRILRELVQATTPKEILPPTEKKA